MRNRKYIYLLGLLIAVSCLKQEVKPAPVSVFEPVPISFSVLQQEFTKTVAVTTADIVSSGFYANATTGSEGSEVQAFANALFTVSGDEFVSENILWPMSDPGYRFYGCNVSMTHSSDGPYVDVTSDTDVVCAVNTSPVYNNSNGLTFKHIFGRIGNVEVTAETGFTISGITIYLTPKTGGRYHLLAGNGQTDGMGWSNLTTGDPVNIANSTPGTKVNDVYLVPGSYTITASWTATKNGSSNTFTDKTREIEISSGINNTITLTLGGR